MKKPLSSYADKKQLNIHKKFSPNHFLSNQNNVLHVLAWGTFWRRNIHRFIIDYLKINLYEYQAIALYEMGISNTICIIASRNNAKSFIVALYAVARCLLYKDTSFRIGAARKKQAKLIVSEKILGELCKWSPMLEKEIIKSSTSDNDIYVEFRNGSKISVFICNDDARGLRSNGVVREEFRLIDKKIDDKVVSPFQQPRKPKYLFDPFYEKNEELLEEPIDIYITSSWHDNEHWMWKIAKQTLNRMKKKKGGVFLAFDESITLKHKIKTINQLKKEKRKQDPISWKIEFLNLRVSDSTSAYFTYNMLTKRQNLKKAFYPRTTIDYRSNKRNIHKIPKLDNEIRVLACDFSFVAGDKNDNSVYSLIRAIPETVVYDTGKNNVEVKTGYRRAYPYMESNQIGDTTLQAVRIRQLYEDFDVDYIVVDARSGGVQAIYSLQRVLYDEERDVEYKPLKCMNNKDYAKACSDSNAKNCIYAINATETLNSDIAIAFRSNLIEGKIDFLVNPTLAKEVLEENKKYLDAVVDDVEKQLFFEIPFLETQLAIKEASELTYEIAPRTKIIRILEQGSKRKDRYTSCSYGSYFIDLLELDSLKNPSNQNFNEVKHFVSKIMF